MASRCCTDGSKIGGQRGFIMDSQEKIVAIGLLRQSDVDALGSTLKMVFPVDQKLMFIELIEALDSAQDRALNVESAL